MRCVKISYVVLSLRCSCSTLLTYTPLSIIAGPRFLSVLSTKSLSDLFSVSRMYFCLWLKFEGAHFRLNKFRTATENRLTRNCISYGMSLVGGHQSDLTCNRGLKSSLSSRPAKHTLINTSRWKRLSEISRFLWLNCALGQKLSPRPSSVQKLVGGCIYVSKLWHAVCVGRCMYCHIGILPRQSAVLCRMDFARSATKPYEHFIAAVTAVIFCCLCFLCV